MTTSAVSSRAPSCAALSPLASMGLDDALAGGGPHPAPRPARAARLVFPRRLENRGLTGVARGLRLLAARTPELVTSARDGVRAAGWLLAASLGLAGALGSATPAHAQGSLTPPPGAPAPTMKTLEELWAKLGELEGRYATLRTTVTTLEAENRVYRTLLVQDHLTWQLSTAGTPMIYLGRPSLAFDAAGQPAIAAVRSDTRDLVLLRFAGGAWTETSVDATATDPENPALLFDAAGQPLIAYYDVRDRDLRLARWDGAAWVLSVLDGAGARVGRSPAITRDAAGRPVIVYHHEDLGDLRCLRMTDATTWAAPVTVDAAGTTGLAASLARGPGGALAASYHDGFVLRVARSADGGATWTTATADAAINTGSYSSVAFAPNGHPAIAYYLLGSAADLRYTAFNGAAWSAPVTADAGVVAGNKNGLFCSLAFAADGAPVIASHDDGAGALRFSRFDGGAWVNTTLEAVQDSGEGTALAIGPDGQPAIAYLQRDAKTLRLARRGLFLP